GRTVRITDGTGRHQERTIVSNDASTVTLSPDWQILPATTSKFVISEEAWQIGGIAQSSPAVFRVPNRPFRTIQISGRAANVHVTRGWLASTAAAHDLATRVFVITNRAFVLPFVKNFFGPPASGSYNSTNDLTNTRIAAVELYVMNSFGNSPVSTSCFTNTV